jgi:hypothetical protein
VEYWVRNDTSHLAWVRMEDSPEIELAPGEAHTFKFSTDREHIFNSNVTREVELWAQGETYQMVYEEDGELRPTESSEFTMEAGERRTGYLTPNRACFKVVNNSNQTVHRAELRKNKNGEEYVETNLGSIAPGESRYHRVPYATSNNNFYYIARITFEDGTELVYGDSSNILGVDEMFLITLNPPSK